MHYSGGFFFNSETKKILLHKRDNKAPVNPNKWGFFGGTSEGDETPLETFVREIKEELNVDLMPQEVQLIRNYLNKERSIQRYVYCVESDKSKEEMTLGEGADFNWISIDTIFTYDITDKTVDDLHFFIDSL